MNCIICATKKFKTIAPRLRDSDAHRVVECQRCHLVQQTPVPSMDEDQKFYDTRQQAKNIGLSLTIPRLRKKQESDLERRTEWIMHNSSPGSNVLDIGSGYGFFLEKMRKRRMHPMGIEISETGRAISKKVTRAKILNINLLKDSFNQTYEVITMFHVLEHISEPVKFLNKVRTLLKINGKLFIEVPNLDDLMLKCNPAYRAFYWQRAHIAYYNEESLRMIARKAGYKKIKVSRAQRYGIENFMNWMVEGKPQLENPAMSVRGLFAKNYDWLEKCYKDYLISTTMADTIMAVAEK